MTEQNAVSEQQYQTIWEEGQGEQPTRQKGDRKHYWEEEGTNVARIVKIERPVPSTESMEPGTTFTAWNATYKQWRRFMVTRTSTGTLYLEDDHADSWDIHIADPTTIRDVQAPPAMPEEDAS